MGYTPPDSVIIGRIQRAFPSDEYLEEKLAKIRAADRDNLIVAVSERLDCSTEDLRGSTTVFSGLDPVFTSMML